MESDMKWRANRIKRACTVILAGILLSISISSITSYANEPTVTSRSAIPMEASTGKIILEHNAKEHLSPASITKIMTLILIFDSLRDNTIQLEDTVYTSTYASSMGGSQVFLAEGESQTVDTMIKCIAVASANDASVAMAEHIAGTEEAFVNRMNDRALELDMLDTHFEDCCGLSDSPSHYTCALDVALMSRELITQYPEIFQYTGIWMEDITHTTRNGSSTFTLTSTNKLIRQYEWATGLKTGSTSLAKYCLSATARKNEIDMIAVVMAAPDHKVRFREAATLLEYGYSVSNLYRDENKEELEPALIEKSVQRTLQVAYEGTFSYLDTEKNDISTITKEIHMNETIEAPVQEGDKVGEAVYYLNGIEIGSSPIVSRETVKKAGYTDYLQFLLKMFLF